MQGTQVGSYRIIAKLGEGGMGAVYLAEHTLMGRKAAVKTLLPKFSAMPDTVRRFFNEAKAASSVRHPGIVEIYDFGTRDDGTAYIAMEYLEGESLERRMRRQGRLSVTEAAGIAQQVVAALGAAHKQGIIHRDLKPDNIYLTPDPEIGERVKLLDFGIAKLVSDEHTKNGPKTSTGMVLGTPAYMSPEQCRGTSDIDYRADFYSLGCILYAMLCGQPPFVDEGAGAVIAAHIYEEPPPPIALEPSIPAELDAFIMRLMAKNRDERPDTHAEIVEALPGIHTHSEILKSLRQSRPPTYKSAITTGIQGANDSSDVAYAPTTMRSSAGVVTTGPAKPAARFRPRVVVAVLGTLAAAGMLAFWLMARHDSASGTDTHASRSTPSTPAMEATGQSTMLAGSGSGPAQPPDTARAGAGLIIIEIDSEPGEAEVIRKQDGERLGQTPFRKEIQPASGELVFILRKPGYDDHEISMSAEQGGRERVALVAQPENPSLGSGDTSSPHQKSGRKNRKKRKDSDFGPDLKAGDAVDPF